MGLPRCLEVRVFRIKALGAFPKSCCSRKTLKNFPLIFNTVCQYSWTFCLSEMTVILMSFMGVYLEEGFETHYYKIMAVPANLTPPPLYLRWLICIFSLVFFSTASERQVFAAGTVSSAIEAREHAGGMKQYISQTATVLKSPAPLRVTKQLLQQKCYTRKSLSEICVSGPFFPAHSVYSLQIVPYKL